MNPNCSRLNRLVLRPLLLMLAVVLLASCGGGGGGGDSSSGGTGGSGYSAADLQGYQWIITDSDGTNSAEPFVFNANGTVLHPGNASFTSGTYSVAANGAFSASLNFGGTVVTLTGTMNAGKTSVVGTEGGAVSGSFTLNKSSTSTGGSGFSAADMQGYQWILTDSNGTYPDTPYVFNANGTVSVKQGGEESQIGSYTIASSGDFSATLYTGFNTSTFHGMMDASKISINGTVTHVRTGAIVGAFTLNKGASMVGPGGTSVLNDSGITACWGGNGNLPRECSTLRAPWLGLNQDGDNGRDALAVKGRLIKVGSGSGGFDFTKIGPNGEKLSVDSTNRWNCVLDNHTGLMWEVKTRDGGLRDNEKTYQWYNPDAATNGGLAGSENGGNNTLAYVNAVNAQGLCGYKDWRLPDRMELVGLVDYSKRNPAINTDFFPTIKGVSYFTSSNYVNGGSAWGVNFIDGRVNSVTKSGYLGDHYVFVVRSAQ
jgi:hypothetical protein